MIRVVRGAFGHKQEEGVGQGQLSKVEHVGACLDQGHGIHGIGIFQKTTWIEHVQIELGLHQSGGVGPFAGSQDEEAQSQFVKGGLSGQDGHELLLSARHAIDVERSEFLPGMVSNDIFDIGAWSVEAIIFKVDGELLQICRRSQTVAEDAFAQTSVAPLDRGQVHVTVIVLFKAKPQFDDAKIGKDLAEAFAGQESSEEFGADDVCLEMLEGGDRATLAEEEEFQLLFGVTGVMLDGHGTARGEGLDESVGKNMFASADGEENDLFQFGEVGQ